MVIMKDGHIQQIGHPLEIYRRPANAFVAGFIGSPRMNFIPLASWPERASSTAATIATPTAEPTAVWPSGTHTVGVRPEHWERASTQAAWTLTVQSVEYLGGQQLVQGNLPCQTRIEVLWEGAPPVQVGDRLSLQVKPGQAHAFDAQGQRLGGTSA
jgi:ABC-type sugar transport system ATPase subunit